MKIAITGHRPEDLPNIIWVTEELENVYKKLSPTLIYTGMAAGVDLLAAEIAYKNSIPYMAVKPWAGHTPRNEDRNRYKQIVDNAEQVINVDQNANYPGVWVYHNRNTYMVDNSDYIIAIWSGKTSGGTYACIKYAKQHNKPIYHINPIAMCSSWLIEPAVDDSMDRLF